VVVVDAVPSPRQEANLLRLGGAEVVRGDLTALDLRPLLAAVDSVVHLAGRPGVQTSWGGGFGDHLEHNVAVSQRLLEAALDVPLRRVLVASSSSVYGDVPTGSARETDAVRPVSPYGVSKAAVELLTGAYAARGVPAVALRYFSVYGRRQRPDMAFSRMIEAARGGPAFPLRGDGSASRDFTHVDDVVEATIRSLDAPLEPGTILNVGSGRPVSLGHVRQLLEDLLGRPLPVIPSGPAAGDPQRTAADLSRVRAALGWEPRVDLRSGLEDQIEAHPGPGVTTRVVQRVA
jgi:nucleoside-diphosphate-sugar epimerase